MLLRDLVKRNRLGDRAANQNITRTGKSQDALTGSTFPPHCSNTTSISLAACTSASSPTSEVSTCHTHRTHNPLTNPDERKQSVKPQKHGGKRDKGQADPQKRDQLETRRWRSALQHFQIGAGLYAVGRPVQKRNITQQKRTAKSAPITPCPSREGPYSTVFSVSRPIDPLMWLAGLLALSGDVETNPGPSTQTWTCDMCLTEITRRQTSYRCNSSPSHWMHEHCTTLTTPLHGNATFTTNKTTRLLTNTINLQTTTIICNKI